MFLLRIVCIKLCAAYDCVLVESSLTDGWKQQGACPGYTGGATDSYGGYAGAGGKAQFAAFL